MEHALSLPQLRASKRARGAGRAGRARTICWSNSSPHDRASGPHRRTRGATRHHAPLRRSARSRRTPPHGTRPRSSRASFTARPPPRACSASAFPRSTAARRPTCSPASILAEEFALAGIGGLHAGLFSHQIGAPPIAGRQRGAEGARAAAGLAGEKISALAITEPGGGSDVANLRTTARARRRRLRRQRREDVHHLGHARRLLHRRGAHRRRRRVRCLAAADRARPPRLHAHAAEEDGLVVLRHRDACISTMCACRRPT